MTVIRGKGAGSLEGIDTVDGGDVDVGPALEPDKGLGVKETTETLLPGSVAKKSTDLEESEGIVPDSTVIPIHSYATAVGVGAVSKVVHPTSISEPALETVGELPISSADVARWRRVAQVRSIEASIRHLPDALRADAESWVGLHHQVEQRLSFSLAEPEGSQAPIQGLARVLGELERLRLHLAESLAPLQHPMLAWVATPSDELTHIAQLAQDGDAWENPALRKAIAARNHVSVQARHMFAGHARGLLEVLGDHPKAQARWLRGQSEAVEVLMGARVGATVRVPDDESLVALRVVAHQMAAHTGQSFELFSLPSGELAIVNVNELRKRSFATDLGSALRKLGAAGFVAEGFAAAKGDAAFDLLTGPRLCVIDVDTPQLVGDAIRSASASKTKPRGSVDKPVERVAIITHNRPDRLASVLQAYIENLQRFGRSNVELVVFDDSSGEVAEKNRGLIQELRRGGQTIRYVGPPEKSALRQRLVVGLDDLVGRDADKSSPVLDAILGAPTESGAWRGGAHAQRNWISLLFAGSRTLVVDDDTQPGSLQVAPETLKELARNDLGMDAKAPASAGLAPLDTKDVTAEDSVFVSYDIVGVAQRHPDSLRSAAYDGHSDIAAKSVIHLFLQGGTASVDQLDGGLGWVRSDERYREKATSVGTFRGSTFVTSSSLDGIDFAYRSGRDQDFTLALTRKLTSSDRQTATGGKYGFTHVHQRGLRWSTQAVATLQEAQTELLHKWVKDTFESYWGPGKYTRWSVTADPIALRDHALSLLNGEAEAPGGKSLEDRITDAAGFWRMEARKQRREVDEMLGQLDTQLSVASNHDAATLDAYLDWFAPNLAAVPGATERLQALGARLGSGPDADPATDLEGALGEIERYLADHSLPELSELRRELGLKQSKALALRRELTETFVLDPRGASSKLVAAVTESMRSELETYFEGLALQHALQQRLSSIVS